jgi:hypothetical protein
VQKTDRERAIRKSNNDRDLRSWIIKKGRSKIRGTHKTGVAIACTFLLRWENLAHKLKRHQKRR